MLLGYLPALSGFFSWNGWSFPARIAYPIFLVHMLIIRAIWNSARTQIYMSKYDTFLSYVTYVICAFIGGLLISLVFEGPIIGLEKILLRKERGANK